MTRAMITGEKVYLRPIERADIDGGWLDWVNDPEVNRQLGSAFPVTREGLERYFEASQPPHAFMFAICEREGSAHVGNARLSGVDWLNRRASFGWLIGDGRCRGRGYGTDALALVVRYGFLTLGLNRISMSMWEENLASMRCAEKVGFQREGILRQYGFKDGAYRDAILMSLLVSEHDARGEAGRRT